MGLHRAGFDVVGIDHRKQPRYPFPFILADALAPPVRLEDFDLVWASPPCQAHSVITRCRRGRAAQHLDLIPATRAMVERSGRLYVIENVPGAPLRAAFSLTGDMFDLLTYRRRLFETNFFVLTPKPGRRFGPGTRPESVTVCGSTGGRSRRDRRENGGIVRWRKAMGIDWMSAVGLAQAVPPAYSEHIARHALEELCSSRSRPA